MNPDTLSESIKMFSIDDAIELVKRQFRGLKNSIFRIVPNDCFLRGWHVLDSRMVFMLSSEMVDRELVGRKDICSLCSASVCSNNRVDHKVARILKIKLLGRVFNRK